MSDIFHSFSSPYPRTRLRRTRQNAWLRGLVAESSLTVTDLIWPVFVQEGKGRRTPIAKMPGVERYSIDILIKEVAAAKALGISAVALFPAVDATLKTDDAGEAFNSENLMCRAIRAIKKSVPNIGVMGDVALDPYTSHGHDGLIEGGEVANDKTVAALCKQALFLAEAGCDIIAPSDMMDGRVGAIRDALDRKGFQQVLIMSYAAKYASNFYGPFREAVGSAGNLGNADKKSYQMDPRNADEALREVALDIQEGADMIIIKPGMPYLDIIRRVRETFPIPVFGYQVSGEYAMIKAASDRDWLDWKQAMLESLIAFKRAGAVGIVTYAAFEAAKWLRES